MSNIIKTQAVVIGAGPGGYTAAFRLADLGKEVVLVERYDNLGGVCLNVGCIPSKALLHTAEIINHAKTAADLGINFNHKKISISKINANKNNIVNKLTSGIGALAKARKVKVITDYAKFLSNTQIKLNSGDIIEFEHCIIAAGSSVAKSSAFPFDNKKVMDSTDALDLTEPPQSLLVVGGGIIGLEMACVYQALGSEITVVELSDQLITSADNDIIKPLHRYLQKSGYTILLNTKINKMSVNSNGVEVDLEDKKGMSKISNFDKALIAIGRTPNSKLIDADKAGVAVDENGFIIVDRQLRTNVDNIFAIGDIIGQPMLAHKAVAEAKVAAEVICGHKCAFDVLSIPSVAYTDPEIAWVGKTEKRLKAESIAYEVGSFPWAASGRSLSIGRNEGVSKALFDKKTKRMIGMGICGTNAGELIAEATLAIEMGATMSDIALSIHPHPTLSETVAFAAEMAEGTITDLLPTKK